MAENDLNLLCEKIRDAKSILIAGHKNPDGDSLCSVLALAGLIKRNFNKDALCVYDGNVPDMLDNVPNRNLMHYYGRVDLSKSFDLAILVDYGTRNHIGGVMPALESAGFVIEIDHHKNDDVVGNLCLDDTSAAAVGEIIFNIATKLKWDFDADINNLIAISVLTDTGYFKYAHSGNVLRIMAKLVDAGVDPVLAASKIKFNMGITENYFMEIAKFRAARLLWAEIVKQYEPKCDCACMMCVNATTTTYNMTMFDSYVNLLRTQTETMSAALGGVHSIVVKPFDAVYEQPTEFSERIARNQQLLLKEESHFDKVVDPAAGSYFIEELTTSLAEAAWKLFLKIEDEGGYLEAVKKGTVQDDIIATNNKRHDDAAKRKEFILGTNQFPNFIETSDGKSPLTCACKCGSKNEESTFKVINSSRLAADYEELRMQTEHSGKVPTAFMLTIGNLAMRQARAQFSSNFLACAGYKIIDNLGFDTVEEGVDAALKAGANIVVLCSSDDEYANYAVPAYNYLAGRAMFIVAGAPACMDDLKAAGIENFIHVRCNVLETLKEYNTKLGIK